MMKPAIQFKTTAREKAADKAHRKKISKAIGTYSEKVAETKSRQFANWQDARKQAAAIKEYALANLPELLLQFEEKITAQGAQVLWAEDAQQACHYIGEIIDRRQAKQVIKSKSMTSEEIGLNEYLEARGVENRESDLGEFIVQLAGEKPYHIVTPAMHKSKAEIAALFADKLGVEKTDSAEDLTMAARRHLRNAFVTADIGITGANFIIADSGAILMTENEGNGRLGMACPKVHIVLVGIEKVLPRLQDLALFLPLLATSGTGQQISCYNSIVRGPEKSGSGHGPEEMIVILLDNGRSQIYSQPDFRRVLRCIRCGACLNACPVFRTVGGHSYGTTYQGPIGSVITPHLRGLSEWHHLAAASSLCGACSDVCPVDLDLHHLILQTRQTAVRTGQSQQMWQVVMKLWAYFFSHKTRLRRLFFWLKPLYSLFRRSLPAATRRRFPGIASQSFSQLWTKKQSISSMPEERLR